MIADDLFAGAGGWDLAAAELGIEARGVEIMPEARATRDAAGLVTIHDDVWTFAPDGNAEGGIASPPCQTFSTAGKGAGRKALDDVLRGIRDGYVHDLDHLRFLGLEVGDERTALVLTPLHFALTAGYEWLAWEQVPAVLPVWEACAVVLRDHGWHVWTGKLHAEQFGVPQTRKRAVLLASRRHHVTSPTPTHSRYYSRTPAKLDQGVAKWVSMAEGLGWGLVERPSYTITGGSGHAAASGIEWGGKSVREQLIEAARGADPDAWASKVHMVSNYGTGGDSSKRGTRTLDQPAPTITSKIDRNVIELCGSPSGITGPVHRPVTHPAATVTGAGNYETHASADCRKTALDSIRLAVHEAGVLQTFPADHPWQGTQGKRYLQAGNAVPPGLALHALMAASGVEAAIRGEVA